MKAIIFGLAAAASVVAIAIIGWMISVIGTEFSSSSDFGVVLLVVASAFAVAIIVTIAAHFYTKGGWK